MKNNFLQNLAVSITGLTVGQMLSTINTMLSIVAFGTTIIFTVLKIRNELKK